MQINPQEIINDIENHYEVEITIKHNDYFESEFKITSVENGAYVSVKYADWTEYTGWRGITSGSLEQVVPTIRKLAKFDGEWNTEVKEYHAPPPECDDCGWEVGNCMCDDKDVEEAV